MAETDLQLLGRYARLLAEDAFAEIVRRHLGLVYSAALRQVRSSQLAEEVSQSVFLDLAQQSDRLAPGTILTAWLYQVTRRTAIDVVRRESRRQLREQIATELNAMNATADDWMHVEPLLDDAMEALDATDRTAVLLRYFENKSLREVGATLGTSDDAAQKRVSRAVERLREFFTRRGVKVGASGLVVAISANAVQAAPAGLALTISTTAALAGTTVVANTAASAATKALAMTALQKTVIGATLAVTMGAGVFEARQNSNLRGELATLNEQQPVLQAQIQTLQRERDEATNRVTVLVNQIATVNKDNAELLRLRAEVGQLRFAQGKLTQPGSAGLDPNDPSVQRYVEARAIAQKLSQYLEQMPDKKIPELKLLTDEDWLIAAREAKFDSDGEVREALNRLRRLAKARLPFGSALSNFIRTNNGDLPADLGQLQPYVKTALGEAALDDATLHAIFERYLLLHTGKAADLPQGSWIVAEGAPVDAVYDSRVVFGNGTSTIFNNGAVRSYSPTGQ